MHQYHQSGHGMRVGGMSALDVLLDQASLDRTAYVKASTAAGQLID